MQPLQASQSRARQGATVKGARGQHGRIRNPDSRAREHRPDRLLETKESHSAELARLQPISELNLMIANGYGDTPQTQLPADWRTRKNEGKKR